MALTGNVLPRENNLGLIGTDDERWAEVHTNALSLNGTPVSKILTSLDAAEDLDSNLVSEKYVNGLIGNEWVDVPENESSTGTVGQSAFDGVYVYRCIATDTWIREPVERSWSYAPVTLFIQTDIDTVGEKTFTLPSGLTAVLNIDWGDGNTEELTGDNTINPSHTYDSAGQYEIEVYGLTALNFSNTPDEAPKVLEIRNWNTSGLYSLYAMFYNCVNMVGAYTGVPVTNDVFNFSYAFSGCTNFNSDLDDLDVSSGIDFKYMFYRSAFNQPIPSWDTSNATSTHRMFREISAFNQPLNHFNMSNVTDCYAMLAKTPFDQPLPDWDVSSVEDMGALFWKTPFNQDISGWDVSSVKSLYLTFDGLDKNDPTVGLFNQNINAWNTASLERTKHTFSRCVFNQPLDNWDMSNVYDTFAMFAWNDAFNQPLNAWDTSSFRDVQAMFAETDTFNQPLNNWNMSKVERTQSMFSNATAFNQDISSWDMSSNWQFTNMFNGATAFNQDLSAWDISSATEMDIMLNNCGMSTENYSRWLISCANQVFNGTASTGIHLDAESLTYNNATHTGIWGGQYTDAVSAKAYLATQGWTFTDGGEI